MPETHLPQLSLGKLPMFFDLTGKTCLLAADNDDALPKARLLLSAGANLTLCIVQPGAELSALCAAHMGRITCHHRSCTEDDFTGIALAIGAFADDQAAAVFAALARQMAVPLNMVDRPALCDFHIPSIVNRTPLIVAISTGGIAPVIGQWLRGRMETLLPPDTGRILQMAAQMRAEILKRLPKLQNRRRFWRHVAEDDLPHLTGQGEGEILTRLQARLTRVENDGDQPGSIHRIIVSDNPDQLRLGQLRALQNADLVISLTSCGALYMDFARRDADRITGQQAAQAMEQALAAASAGHRVIWLTGPDSAADDAALEQACTASGIRYRNES